MRASCANSGSCGIRCKIWISCYSNKNYIRRIGIATTTRSTPLASVICICGWRSRWICCSCPVCPGRVIRWCLPLICNCSSSTTDRLCKSNSTARTNCWIVRRNRYSGVGNNSYCYSCTGLSPATQRGIGSYIIGGCWTWWCNQCGTWTYGCTRACGRCLPIIRYTCWGCISSCECCRSSCANGCCACWSGWHSHSRKIGIEECPTTHISTIIRCVHWNFIYSIQLNIIAVWANCKYYCSLIACDGSSSTY